MTENKSSVTTITSDPNCEDDYDATSLSCDEALGRILDAVSALDETEHRPVRECLNRVLATPITSSINVPGHVNSAVDGYALAASDLPDAGTVTLSVIGSSFAGKPYLESVKPGETVRIMTGAVVPDGCDTVIMQENVVRNDNEISADGRTRRGDNVRAAGEDIKVGETVLGPGQRLGPAELGLIASLGIGSVDIVRPIKVAFISTGDELRSVGEELNVGEIYDSNRYTLFGMLSNLHVDVIDLGVVRDEPNAVRQALKDAANQADVVITSGGVSVGEADYIKDILHELGQVGFWKVAMKPGRPLAFGNIDDTLFFGLPGNPVSVMVTFYQFVQPALLKLMGTVNQQPLLIEALTLNPLKKRPGRVEYQRGYLSQNSDGKLCVSTDADQGSGILSSMSRANCFIVLPMDSGRVEVGETVAVQPFHGLL